MADEDIISVTNNENPSINLEIISYTNEVGVTFVQAKGDKGDTGEKGDTGAKGDKGDVGSNTMLVGSFTGSINGSNTTFVLNDHYDDVIVFINGIKYAPADYSYTKLTATVVFGFAIPSGYTLEFYGITNKSANVVPLEDLAVVASSGSYQDLLNKPSIPSKTSDLTNDSSFATTTQVNTAIQNVVNAAPAALDTLKELADAINDDANFASTVTTALSNKVDKVSGKGLSANDLTNTLKTSYDSAVTNSHTHSNATALNNVSGTNTGDETLSTIKSKLGITALSGSNTGDQDLSGLVAKTTTVNGKALSSNITLSASDVGAESTISTKNTAFNQNFETSTSNIKADGTVSVGSSNNVARADHVHPSNGTSLFHLTAAIGAIATSTTFNIGGYYSSAPIVSGSGEAAVRMYVPRRGTITKCYLTFTHSAVGSAETSSVYIRVNNTTDYLVSNAINNASWQTYFNNLSLNIPVNAGDYFWLKWITPSSYATSPMGFALMSDIEVDF